MSVVTNKFIILGFFVSCLIATHSYAQSSNKRVTEHMQSTQKKLEIQKKRQELIQNAPAVPVPEPDIESNSVESFGVVQAPVEESAQGMSDEEFVGPKDIIERDLSNAIIEAEENELYKKHLIKSIRERAKEQGVEVKIIDN